MCLSLEAQFPDNFEFLEHGHTISRIGAQKVHNDAVYFVSHNYYKPHTLVSKATADGHFEVLLKPKEYDARASKLFIQNDSSFQLVLYDLIDYDVPAGGIYVVNVSGSEVSIDTIVDYDMFPIFTGGFTNIEKDENGDWISVADQEFRFDKTGITSIKPKLFHHNSELFSNQQGELFVIENNKRLSSFKNGSLSLIEEFSENCRHIDTRQGNYLRVGNQLVSYEDNFTERISEWSLSGVQGEIKVFKEGESNLEFMTVRDESYFLYQLNGAVIDLIFTGENVQDEVITNFEQLSEKQYLFTGNYSIADISDNIFFRNVNIIDNSTTVYPKADVAALDFEITQTEKDTYDIIVSFPDTFYGVQYFYDLTATIMNEDQEDLHTIHAFTQQYSTRPRSNVSFQWGNAPGSATAQADTVATTYNSGFREPLTLVVPGANYRFNKNENKIITGQVRSAVTITKPTKHLAVFPNPVSEQLKLDIDNTLNSVTIFDQQGRMMYYNLGENQEVDVSSLKSGNYIISVKSSTGKNLSLGKFIKL